MLTPPKRSQSLLFPALILILIAAGAIWYFFLRTPPPQTSSTADSTQADTPPGIAREANEPSLPQQDSVAPVEPPSAAESPDSVIQEPSPPAPSLPTEKNIAQAGEKINAFYQYLDQQKYIQAYQLDTSSHIYFTRLLHKALDNPPINARETDDLLTILKNSAHFFRIFGKKDILLCKEVLKQENDRIEEVMAGYFLLLTKPAKTQEEDNDVSLINPEGAMYEYACFFLNTMGGKLYLTRRDSLSRMLVTYYAILIVHQANVAENNKHGLLLQPAIDLLTAEMETGGNHLRFKETYLDKLYDLKEKYQ